MVLLYRRLVLLSPLRPEEAAAALRAAVAPRRSWGQMAFRRGKGNYMGEVTENGFSLVRDMSGRNSFRPHITGTIETGSPASRIAVSMKMHPATTGFMAVWLLATLFGLSDAAQLYFKTVKAGGHMDPQFFYVLGIMAAFGFCLPFFGFIPEAKKAENFLKETLRATVETPPDSRRAI